MFSAGDDDDEEATMGAVRYSVMPSLVALQQMRNRLHLAYLGRKLMKWTALATGKELRKISLSIAELFQHYAEQMSTAYMLLARARFYVPKVNDVVLENISSNASSVIGTSMRSISGVKIRKFQLNETGFAPYPLLGIEKGGKAIQDSKAAWFNLLKLMVKILQQRTTFEAVEKAHRSATQRGNLFRNVIIPRTQKTIVFLLAELKDSATEELFRIKKIRAIKKRQIELKEKQKTENMDDKEKPDVSKPATAKEVCKICGNEMNPQALLELQKQEVPMIEISPAPISANDNNFQVKLKFLNSQLKDLISISKNLTTIKSIDIKEFIRVCEDVSSKIENLIITENAPAMDDFQNSVGQMKQQLHEIMKATQKIIDRGSNSQIMEKFGHSCTTFSKNLGLCSCLKLPDVNKLKLMPTLDVDLDETKETVNTEHFAIELILPAPREVPDYMKKTMASHTPVELNQIFENKTGVVTEMQNPKLMLTYGGEIPKETRNYMKNPKSVVVTDKVEINPLSEESQISFIRLEEFKNHVDEVINMIKYYQSAELLNPNAEEFLDSCKAVKIKIDEYKNQRQNKNRLQRLKEEVNLLEQITSTVETDELMQPSMDNFLLCCKEFKTKLEDSKTSKRSPTNDSLEKLLSQIDDTILLSEEAKKEGLVSDSVDEFIKGCLEIKARLEYTDIEDKSEEPDPKVLDELSNNIVDIMDFISKYRDEGLISPSVEEFFKTCELTKVKLSFYKQYLPLEVEDSEEPLCRGHCLCGQQDPDEELCDRCKEMLLERQCPTSLPSPPCNTCQSIKQQSPLNIYKTYCEELDSKIDNESLGESLEKICNSCKRRKVYKKIKNTADLQEADDSSFDDKEAKNRKITRVRRYEEKDGNIKEKRETITIRKEKNDPHETILIEDETDYDVNSYDSIMNDIKRVGMCDIPQTKGFLRAVRHVRSTDPIKDTPWVQPILKSCISVDILVSRTNETQNDHLILYDFTPFSVIFSSHSHSNNN